MANRYLVGVSGTWNTTSTANWSASSGGAAGASAPTSADAVFIDANSGGGTVTLGEDVSILPLTLTGFTGTVEVLKFPAGSFFTGKTASGTSVVYMTPGEGL